MDRNSDKGGEGSPSARDGSSGELRRQARDWLVLLASGESNAADRARLRQWLDADQAHEQAFASEEAIWRNLAHVKDELAPAAKRARTADPIYVEPGRDGRRRFGVAGRTGLATAALAACLVLMTISGDILIWLRADYSTAAGEQMKVTLSDGSIAHLNTDTAISVDYSESRRGIGLLRGEAHFTVTDNRARPFVVTSYARTARAVGTAFAVREDDGTIVVTVTSGKVDVASENPYNEERSRRPAIRLVANEQLVYRDGGAASGVKEVDTHSALGWREGRIVIDDMPFQAAMSELDRYMAGRIVIASRRDMSAKVSGVFSQDRLDSAVRVLAATQGLTVQYITPYLVLLY